MAGYVTDTSSDLYDTLLTIRFDDGSDTTFDVHRGLICHHSTYFHSALKSEFVQGTKCILPAADKDPFRVFMRWMYTLRLHEPETTFTMQNGGAQPMIMAYVFASMRGIPGLKNAIIDLLLRNQIKLKFIPTSCLQYVWTNTTPDDALRKLFLDWYIYNPLKSDIFDYYNQYPVEFMCQLMNRVIDPKTRPPLRSAADWLQSKCLYHDHNFARTDDESPLKTEKS